MRYVRPIALWSIALLMLLVPTVRRTPALTAQGLPLVFVASAQLIGAGEVPPVTDTTATGIATYRLTSNGQALQYTLIASGFTSQPTAAHIHASAPPGQNAPVVAFLFPPNAHSSCSSTSALLLKCAGEIRAEDLVGPLAGQPLSVLLVQMNEGLTYTNAHTTLHPGGEIRGQNESNGGLSPISLLPTLRCRGSIAASRSLRGVVVTRRC